jgi:Tol biopolymer transport system component
VAFVLARSDAAAGAVRSRIWLWEDEAGPLRRLVARARGRGDDPELDARSRPLTRPDEDATSPAFSPDGDAVAFLAARPGPGAADARHATGAGPIAQVWVLPLDGGDPEAWTGSPTPVEEFVWAPDGSLLWLARAPEATADGMRPPKRVWRVPPGGGPGEMVVRGDPGVSGLALSSDGARLAWRSDGTGDPAARRRTDLFALDLRGGEPIRLVERPGEETSPAWSDDGHVLYFLAPLDPADDSSPTQLWAVPAGGGALRRVSAKVDRSVAAFAVAPRSDRLFAVVDDGPDQLVVRIVPDSRNVYEAPRTPGPVPGLAAFPGGGKVAFVAGRPPDGPELATWSYGEPAPRLLTALNAVVPAGGPAPPGTPDGPAPDGADRTATPIDSEDAR